MILNKRFARAYSLRARGGLSDRRGAEEHGSRDPETFSRFIRRENDPSRERSPEELPPL